MRRLVLVLFLCLISLGFGSLLESKVLSYPSGIIFPLWKTEEIAYLGEIVDLIQKSNGNVYFSTRKGFVYFIDILEKKIIWKFEAQNPIICPPHLSAGKMFILDKENTIYCLDKGGELLWKKEIEENITSGVREYQGMIYLGTSEGGIFAFDSLNGEMFWNFQAEGAIRSGPVFASSTVIFSSDDGNLYFLNQKGDLEDKIKIGSKIEATPLVDKNLLYFGARDHNFYCLDLISRRMKWKVKTGGGVISPPLSDKKRVFFVSLDNVLYSLNKKSGSILWWQFLPSRSYYQLEIVEKKIIVSSFSPTLVCFDVKTGEDKGKYEAEQEIRSNPLWFDPYLLVNLYDHPKEMGKLIFLTKLVKATITPSKSSPQKLGEDVTFTASAVGFFQPKYEFYLKIGERMEIVQEASRKNSWTWFPEKDGTYVIGVRVVDAKEKAVREISFTIEKEQKI